MIVQCVGNLHCTWLTWVQSYIVPPLQMISECRVRCDPRVQLGIATKKNKKERIMQFA